MRVTETTMLAAMTSSVDNSSSNYETLQDELSTGRRINEPSDDPNGASQAMTVRSLLVNISQYQSDASSATSFLKYTDSQISSVVSLVQSARTTAVAAANSGTTDSSEDSAYAATIQSAIDQLTNLANSSYGGENIFAGQKTTTAPYTSGDATHAYSGDEGALNATIGQGNTMQINIPGDQVFGKAFAALEQLKTDITSGDATSISNTDLPAIDASLSDIGTAQAKVGTKIDTLNDATAQLGTTQLNYQSNLSSLEDVDIATVYTQLQSAQNVYQASLVAASKAMQYSLAQYLQ